MESIQLDPDRFAQEPQGDPAGLLLVPLLRSRWLIVSLVLLGAAGGIAFGIVQPNTYLSTGKLLVRYGAREEVTPEAVIAGPGAQGYGQPRDLVNNERELLAVPQVFERVVREVTPPRIFSSYDPRAEDGKEIPQAIRFFHRFQAWWFRRSSSEHATKLGHALDNCPACVSEASHTLMKDLGLNVEPGSSVITISYAAHDPALAREVVGCFLSAAEERHRETYSTNTTLEFVSERLQESLVQKQTAETEFNEYRLTCDVSDFDSQRTQLRTLAQDLDKQAAEDSSKLAQLRSRSTVLTGLLAEQPATINQEVEPPPLADIKWTFLQTRLYQLEDALDVLGNKVGGTTAERDADETRIKQRIESTKAELKDQVKWVKQTPVQQAVPNPDHQRLKQEFDDLKQEIAAQETVTEKVVDRLQSVRRRLVATEQCEPRYHLLEEKLANADDSYKAFRKTHERTYLMSLLDQLEFSNLRRIQDATMPFEKEGPKRTKFVIVGLLLGGLLGGALAFALHTFDPFVRSPSDVERLLGLRVVGVMPRSRLPRRLRRAIRRALRSAAL